MSYTKINGMRSARFPLQGLGGRCGCGGTGQVSTETSTTTTTPTTTTTTNSPGAWLVFGGIMAIVGVAVYFRFKTTSDIARQYGVKEALKYEAGLAGIQAVRELTSPRRNRRRRRKAN